MADLVAADLSYEVVDQTIEAEKRINVVKITTAAGEYPTGGLPLTKGKLGLPNVIDDLVIVEKDAASDLDYKYDASEEKIKVLNADGTEFANAAFTSPDELIVKARGWYHKGL